MTAQPVTEARSWTRGTGVLLGIAATGILAVLWRIVAGLGPTTNLDDDWPWGLWVAVNIDTGVALSAAGFTTTVLVHVLHRDRYAALMKPALLTALLGYTFAVIGLLLDLGRPWAVWHPLVMWQGNSVLFEISLCVATYLTVLYLEFAPIAAERYRESGNRFLRWLAVGSARILEPVLPVILLAGVVLSFMHQSSLGGLMVIAPSKMSPLWFSPLLPLLFLMSAIAVGPSMVLLVSLAVSRAFGRPLDLPLLSRFARFVPILGGISLGLRLWDLTVRGAWSYLDWSAPSFALLLELALYLAPVGLLSATRFRQRPAILATAAILAVMGVGLNRYDTFLTAYTPTAASSVYVPSFLEFASAIGLIACAVLLFRTAVIRFPVLALPRRSE